MRCAAHGFRLVGLAGQATGGRAVRRGRDAAACANLRHLCAQLDAACSRGPMWPATRQPGHVQKRPLHSVPRHRCRVRRGPVAHPRASAEPAPGEPPRSDATRVPRSEGATIVHSSSASSGAPMWAVALAPLGALPVTPRRTGSMCSSFGLSVPVGSGASVHIRLIDMARPAIYSRTRQSR